jgi:hypothetical protein
MAYEEGRRMAMVMDCGLLMVVIVDYGSMLMVMMGYILIYFN